MFCRTSNKLIELKDPGFPTKFILYLPKFAETSLFLLFSYILKANGLYSFEIEVSTFLVMPSSSVFRFTYPNSASNIGLYNLSPLISAARITLFISFNVAFRFPSLILLSKKETSIPIAFASFVLFKSSAKTSRFQGHLPILFMLSSSMFIITILSSGFFPPSSLSSIPCLICDKAPTKTKTTKNKYSIEKKISAFLSYLFIEKSSLFVQSLYLFRKFSYSSDMLYFYR